MKNTHNQQTYLKRLLFSILLVCGLAIQLSGTAIAAGTATLTLSPSSGSYNINTSLSVTIHENSGANGVNAVQANLTYDPAKLQFVSLDTNSSAFDLSGPGFGGSGSVKISRAKSSTTLTGDQIVASVNFNVLAGSGTTSISFDNTSCSPSFTQCTQIVNPTNPPGNQNIWNGSAAGGTYTLTGASPVTPTPTPTTPKSTTTTSSKPTTTSPTAKTTTPTTTTNTNPPATTTPDTPIVTANSINTGNYVAIKVVDANGKGVKGAVVTVDGDTQKSDGTGLASFSSISAGQHTVSVSANGQKTTKSITVATGTPTTAQQFSVSLAINKKVYSWKIIAPITAILLILLGIVGLGIGRRASRTKNEHNLDSYNPTETTPSTTIQSTNDTVASPKPPDSGPPDQVAQPPDSNENKPLDKEQ